MAVKLAAKLAVVVVALLADVLAQQETRHRHPSDDYEPTHDVWTRQASARSWARGPDADMARMSLVNVLTSPERYNRHERPLHGQAPVNVSARSFIYMLQSIEGRLNMELKLSLKLLLAFRDPRLEFAALSPGTRELAGGTNLTSKLWTPHIFLSNEHQSLLMTSSNDQDVLVRIRPDGYVLFVTRFTVTVICGMTSGRFPFDQQDCPMFLESWLEDAEDLDLRWAHDEGGERGAVTTSNQQALGSFVLDGWRTEHLIRSRIKDHGLGDADHLGDGFRSLQLTFSLSRQSGFFIMDYYLPSVLLVVISWVSFWLDPDVVPARVLLGSSTMLTFITLAVQADRSLPVSYVKASEIWFVGCCSFIFGSLVEFAFVNTIWRQGQSVELKKVSTKHILRSTLGTPKPPRRRLLPQERYARRRTSSLPDLFKPHLGKDANPTDHEQAHPSYYNTIHAGTLRPSPLAAVCESAETRSLSDDDQADADTASEGGARSAVSFDSVATAAALDHDTKLRPQVAGTRRQSMAASRINSLAARLSACWCGGAGGCGGYGRRIAVTLTPAFTRMSAQEVSDWIDRRSRVFFPLAFLVFNCVYWTFVIWF